MNTQTPCPPGSHRHRVFIEGEGGAQRMALVFEKEGGQREGGGVGWSGCK